MKVDIPYGKQNIKITIPNHCHILVPNKVSIKNQDALIENALEKPLGYASYDEFAENAEKLLVIINDATRPTPEPVHEAYRVVVNLLNIRSGPGTHHQLVGQIKGGLTLVTMDKANDYGGNLWVKLSDDPVMWCCAEWYGTALMEVAKGEEE